MPPFYMPDLKHRVKRTTILAGLMLFACALFANITPEDPGGNDGGDKGCNGGNSGRRLGQLGDGFGGAGFSGGLGGGVAQGGATPESCPTDDDGGDGASNGDGGQGNGQCKDLGGRSWAGSAGFDMGLGPVTFLHEGVLRRGGFVFELRYDTVKAASVFARPAIKDIRRGQPAGELLGGGGSTEASPVRQIVTMQYLADLQDLPAGQSGYTMTVYILNPRPAKINGLYDVSGLGGRMVKRITVRNPDGTALNGRFEILEEEFGPGGAMQQVRLHGWEERSDGWVAEVSAGGAGGAMTLLRRDTLSNKVTQGGLPCGNGLNPDVHTEIRYTQDRKREERGSDGVLRVVYEGSEQRAFFGKIRESVLLRKTRQAGGGERTDEWEYYTDPLQSASYGRVKSYRRWDGYWERHTYEQGAGNLVLSTLVRPWLDASFEEEVNVEKITRLEDHKLRLAYNEERRVCGQVVSRQTMERKLVAAPNASGGGSGASPAGIPLAGGPRLIQENYYEWDGNANLMTEWLFWDASAENEAARGRVHSVKYPNGLVEWYHYEQLEGGVLRITEGQGTGEPGAVSAGVRTRWDMAPDGQLLEEIRVDIASGLELSRRTADTAPGFVDAQGRFTKYYYNNNPADYEILRLSTCGDCGKTRYARRRDGRETSHVYDGLERLTRTESGYPGGGSLVTVYYYGENSVRETVSRGGLSSESERIKNGFGETILEITPDRDGDAQPEVTQHEQVLLADGGMREIVTRPDGSTLISEYYRDGRARGEGGTGRVEKHHEHGLWNGGLWSMEKTGPESTPAASRPWTKVYTDRLGREVKTERHLGGGQLATTTSHYDGMGRLIKTVDADGLATLYAYNNLGERIRTALDLNNNGVIDLAGPDRVTESLKQYINDAGFGASEQTLDMIYPETGSAEPLVAAVTVRSLDGLKTREEHFGRVSTRVETRSVNGARTVTATDPQGVTVTETYAQGLLADVEARTSDNIRVDRVERAHDALGRVLSQTDARIGATAAEYDAAGQLIKTTAPDGSETSYAYDRMGRVIKITLPDGTEQFAEYDAQGRVTRNWGAQAYTTAHVFDAFGNQTGLHTFKDGDDAAPQVTTWIYDAGGRLIQKHYADGHGPSYAYTPGGRLLTRTWARLGTNGQPLATSYTYTTAGELATADYSDATPDVSYTYDRLGRQTGVTDGAGARTYAYRVTDLALENETHAGLLNATLVREYDTLGRLHAVATADTATRYAYDPAGRIHKVERLTPGAPVSGMPATHYSLPATADETHTYAYVPDSNLIASVAGPVHTVLNTYEANRDVLVKKENKVGTTTISQHVYTVNTIGQRTAREQTGAAFSTPSTDAFAYNVRGEVVASTNTQRPTLDTAYNYDGIGNRLTSQDGLGQRNYTANTLNQYTHVGAPLATPAAPAYDLDGNMTSDGLGRALTWDAENRLITVETETARVAYTYDGLSRRVRRAEYTRPNPLAPWAQTADRHYLYDGWNVIAEYEGSGGTGDPPVLLARTHVWGLDLSNTEQGAGGVGGLLSTREGSGTGGQMRYYTYDGNGNVSEVLGASGTAQTHYEYDPFGNLTVSTGAWANSNVWRFSTKPYDAASDLYYYGYRFYSSWLGRWSNRDPLEESGGINLLVFCNNNPIYRVDTNGLVDLNLFTDSTDRRAGDGLKTLKNVYSIAAHGNQISIAGKPTADIAKTILADANFSSNPRPILLLACTTGVCFPSGMGITTGGTVYPHSVAQELANLTGYPVIAPSDKIMLSNEGKEGYWIHQNGSRFNIFSPNTRCTK